MNTFESLNINCKNPLMRTIIVSILPLFLVIFFVGCNSKKEESKSYINTEYSTYVRAFTSGEVSKSKSIKVFLTQPIDTNKFRIGEALPDDLFDLSPRMSGVARYSDPYSIEFVPDKWFESGEKYTVSFDLKSIAKDVPEKLKEFNFDFQIFELDYNILLKGIDKNSSYQKVNIGGEVIFSDLIDTTELTNLVQIDGVKGATIQWKEINPLAYEFILKDCPRAEKEYAVRFKFDGSKIGVDKSSTEEFKIPALGDFKVTDVNVDNGLQQSITFNFSDPINNSQGVKSFFRMEGTTFKTVVSGNYVKIYPNVRQNGEKEVEVLAGLKNTNGAKMLKGSKHKLSFFAIKPALELLGKGSILPSSNKGLLFPFKSVNISSVVVTITKVFTDNIGQFLQVNNLSGTYQMHRVSRKVLRRRINLKSLKNVNLSEWNEFSIDLSDFVNVDPGAIYRVNVAIDKKGSNYPCKGSKDNSEESLIELNINSDFEGWDESAAGYDGYYNHSQYNYSERENPCSDSYYNRKSKSRNILASNLGITVKSGSDRKYHVYVADLLTTQPSANVEVEVLDYQQQVIGRGATDGNGMSTISPKRQPFLIIVKNGDERGYLKVRDGLSLSTSKFETSGQTHKGGLKGYLYTERGVRRPGDSIYVAFMIEDQTNKLPMEHPVHFELVNPKGKTIKKAISIGRKDGIHVFRTNTDKEDPTGNWSCRAEVGNSTFYKTIKVETVKPNRLKIDMDFNQKIISKNDAPKADLKVEWLHGAIARDLETKVEMRLQSDYNSFPKHKDYIFNDPLYKFSESDQMVFEGKINDDGNASFKPKFEIGAYTPGMLKAFFKTRVFEKSGDFSVDRFSVKFSPYDSYVGVSVPSGSKWGNVLETGKDHQVGVVIVNKDGEKQERKNVKVKVYKIENRWWWDNYNRDLASYINKTSTELITDTVMEVKKAGSFFTLREEYPEWGRYLIRVTDPVSGHSSGKIVTIDWPYWRRAARDNQDFATMLNFQSSKSSYKVGENIKVNFPTGGAEKALITIENGISVIKSFWIETGAKQTSFEIAATPDMAPNIYVSISLIQPHGQTVNDMPIRMYGTIPVNVEDPKSHIHPVIDMPDEIRPESITSIKVNEKEGREMVYTLAMVDEGLLDLTRFATPNPWKHFYAKQALGVKTWDMYDNVIGAYGAKLNRILGIGGDGSNEKKGGKKANRFKPMVKFLGEFKLEAGEVADHKIKMPNYIGRVRVMVVARNKNAFGSVDKSVKVKKPLMVLATLPRVLGPNEELSIPVNVFALNDGQGKVKVTLKTNDLIQPTNGTVQILNFNKAGDKILEFPVKVSDKIGFGKVEVVVESGKETAKHEIEINVRASNPEIDDIIEVVVKPGDTWNSAIKFPGIEGTNSGSIEISTFPAMNLTKRLKYLIQYPHGCIEQTTSSVFPQLHLDKVMDLSLKQKRRIIENITNGISRISKFQTDRGGFSYWPGGNEPSEWGSNYAGHFLLEAKDAGYKVPNNLMENWVTYQKRVAKRWRYSGKYFWEYNTQAYRLYVLAKAGHPDFASMNFMKSKSNLNLLSKWRLAASYAMAGQIEVAREIANKLTTEISNYRELSYSYGSGIRDKAMILETLLELNDKNKAVFLAKDIAKRLGQSYWMSTQTTAYSLLSVSKFLGDNNSDFMQFDYKLSGNSNKSINAKIPVYKVDLEPGEDDKITLKNTGKSLLFVKLLQSGVPSSDDRSEQQSHLAMNLKYYDLDDNKITPDTIQQGTDFKVEVTVKNPGTKGYLREMAINQIFPSGWEIHNSRMDLYNSEEGSRADYKDIRDDRVYTYYGLGVGSTKTFVVKLSAAYKGKFYLPSVESEAMYDNTINARKKGRWVVVK
ncbi:MAG: hypothetical protein CMD18_05665 [Flavobacteriales bacterium]|nr:hypothetical protein [Flavobacteriales bacterium]